MSTIYFTPRAMALLQAYVALSEGEVSGIGKVERLDSGDFLVSEILLLEQESSWASTELDDEALAHFLEELISKGDDPSSYKLWWHSHGFKVFWSATDEETCQRFQNRWMLSVVIDKSGGILGRIDVYEPIHLSADLPVRVHTRLEEEEIEAIKEELEQKVHRKRTWALGWGRWGWEQAEGEQAPGGRGKGTGEEDL